MSTSGKNLNSTSKNGNFVIPAILLLVSAIVIIATFYEEEYKGLVASDNQTESTETITNDKITAEAEALVVTSTDKTIAGSEVVVIKSGITEQTVSTKTQVTTAADTSAKAEETSDRETEGSVNVATASEEKMVRSNTNIAAISTAPVANNTTIAEHISANINNRQMTQRDLRIRAHKNAIARAQVQKNAYNARMQQHRQAYETEMVARRMQYETMMKTRKEKRVAAYETRKAIFQRAQKNRIETNQKMQEVHKRISELHEEIHQIMHDSRTSFNKPTTQTIEPVSEQI
ncbi:hypothetical protein MNBD_GAMMA05-1328 [hydrothermal vent metagenome]|uniref:Uncharacterized protein n=1 Tax=hydrothermal vent metagenome TaxID=652676 RepID=A0A3B0X316_9ZZZZ